MSDYYNFGDEEIIEESVMAQFNEMMREYDYKRPRYQTLEEALNFDKEFINKLLNLDDLAENEAAKAMIAEIHDRTVFEFTQTNEIAKSFDDFIQERLGDEKYNRLIMEYLQRQGNEFFQGVGMEEMMKPGAIYLFKPEQEESEDGDEQTEE